MRATTLKLGPFAAPSAVLLRAAAAIGGAGALVLLTPTVDANARRIIFTSSGNDTGITFTITGTDWNGSPATEVLTGANAGIATSTYDYKTVTSVVASGAAAGTVSIGTSGAASTRPLFLDSYADNNTSIYVAPSGSTQIYTVEYCGEDPNRAVQGGNAGDPGNFSWQNLTWVNSGTAALVGATTKQIANQAGTYTMARLTTSNAGASITDFATAAFSQAMNAPL